jgi:tetratricopeptide (TPR) repeat protein
MIVRDGAETLEKALASVKPYVQEIVIGIDSRTTDSSRTIARRYSKNVFDYDWIEDFSAARNLVARKAKHDLILVVDADDEIEPGKESVLRDAVNQGDGVRFVVSTSPTSEVQSIRLYNRKTARYVYKVHEYLKFTAGTQPTIVDIPIIINHRRGSTVVDPGRNLRILDDALSEYPRYLFYHGKECLENNRYEDAIVSFSRYLELSTWPAEAAEAWLGIARAHILLKDLDAARKACFEAVLIDPNFIPAYNLLGQICSVTGQYSTAIRWYEHALHCQDTRYVFDNRVADKFNCWGNLILAYAKTGDRVSSNMAVIEAEAIRPGNDWIKSQVEAAKE